MSAAGPNLAASVAARLLSRARETGDDYQTLLTNFCFERFLRRLGQSQARSRFVLKGAMLLRVWADQPYRSTRDLDLLRLGDGSAEAIARDITDICATKVEPDALDFDVAALRFEPIRAEDEYAGTRVVLPARSGSARLRLQVDIGVGDAVWPAPRDCTYPPMLAFEAPDVLAYPPEAVVAEKLEAIVLLGDRNSRIKDFFDLDYIARHFEFDRATLAEAVRRTFARRATPIPTEAPVGLTTAYWQNPSRPAQVAAFVRRTRLAASIDSASALLDRLAPFLLPILDDLRTSSSRTGTWLRGGPWS
jgi:predicted nucleotidyltransferase component of viral defense system